MNEKGMYAWYASCELDVERYEEVEVVIRREERKSVDY